MELSDRLKSRLLAALGSAQEKDELIRAVERKADNVKPLNYMAEGHYSQYDMQHLINKVDEVIDVLIKAGLMKKP